MGRQELERQKTAMEEQRKIRYEEHLGPQKQFPGNPPGQISQEELEPHRITPEFLDTLREIFRDGPSTEELLSMLTK
jgi:hypothetical protein